MPKYPEIEVRLDGEDGNVFDIIGRCLKAMRRADLSESEQRLYIEEAKSGDYDHTIRTCVKWFDVT